MTQISTYVERIEIVFEESASIKVIQVNEAQKIDGVVRQITPVAASSITDAKVKAILEASSQAVTAERDALQTQVTTLTGERDTLQSQADTIPGLQSQIESLTAANAELKAEVARLTALVPPPRGPREVTPEEFLTRFSAADIVAIDQSTDPRVVIAKVTLQTRSSVISLDSPLLAEMIDGLIAAGIPIDAADRERIFA